MEEERRVARVIRQEIRKNFFDFLARKILLSLSLKLWGRNQKVAKPSIAKHFSDSMALKHLKKQYLRLHFRGCFEVDGECGEEKMGEKREMRNVGKKK